MKRKIYCTIPQDQIKEPLLYTLGNQFQVVPNIRGASVTDEIALLALELEGDAAEIDRAIQFLCARGVKVEDLSDAPDAHPA
ncbi:MAG: FeS-binding protein [Planctomycetota bacterium]|nr:MAG: FeS-binding protein [Planctomycetota bacterium]